MSFYRGLRILVVLLVAAAQCSIAFAQQGTAAINGQVSDASGSAIVGAKIEAVNTGTNATYTATTNEAGLYNLPTLQTGTYQITATKEGFQQLIRPGVELHVSDVIGLNLSLQVGSVSQTVTVESGAPLVETTSSELGGLVSETKIADLPLNGRNYIDLSLLQAGVNSNPNGTSMGGMGGTVYTSNGASILSNSFLLDGTSIVNQSGWGTSSFAGTTLGVDGIREYKILTSAWDASYGMSMGSQMVMVSKGGTNQFHGDVFEYFRNSTLNARNYFDTVKPPLTKNNFGASFGGPIRKDKTFFYAVYEGLQQTLGFSAVDTVPAAGCHNGPSGAPLQPGDTITSAQCPTLGSGAAPVTVASGLAGQEVLQMLATYPSPNFTTGTGATQYRFPSSTKIGVNYGQIRFDHNFSSSDIMFARYTTDESTSNAAFGNGTPNTSGAAFPQFRGGGDTKDQFLTLSETHIFSPSVSNTARLSFSRTGWHSFWIYGDQSQFKIPTFSFLSGMPWNQVAITGLTTAGFGSIAGPPQTPALHLQNIYSLADDVYYTRGKHQFRFGTLINRFNEALTVALSSFEGSTTYNSFANFLKGVPTSFAAEFPGSDINRDFLYNSYGFYGQDDWRVTSRLTFNLGLRYEFLSTLREQNNKSYAVQNVATDASWTAGPVLRNRTKTNFSPRFGFAWDIFGDGKTALRGGGGVYYDIGNYGGVLTGNSYTAYPSVLVTISNPSSQVFTFPYSVPTAAQAISGGVALNVQQTFDYNALNPLLYQYNLTLQRQLPKNMALSIAYVGTQGAHIWQQVDENPIQPTAVVNGTPYWDINNPSCQAGTLNNNPASVTYGAQLRPTCRTNPNWGTIVVDSSTGLSNYNALQAVFSKRLAHGLQMDATYTFSHSLSTANVQLLGTSCVSGMDTGVSANQKSTDWGPSCTDVRHNMRFSTLYHFPTLKSEGLLAKVANGWWMGNIVAVQGGLAFTPFMTTSRSASMYRAGAIEYPNINTQTITKGQILTDALGHQYAAADNFVPYDPNTVITHDPNQWFNPNMFSLQPVVPCPGVSGTNCNTLGNVTRGLLRGPGLGSWDFSLVKDTAIPKLGEAGSIQFRAEFFNILNRPNFATPGPQQATGPVIFANTGAVTPVSLYGAYSQAPIKLVKP